MEEVRRRFINPAYVNHLIIWGEAETVNIKTDTTPKVTDQVVECMMVGYVINHDGGCNRMWNPKKNYIYEYIYAVWLQIKYFPKQSVTP